MVPPKWWEQARTGEIPLGRPTSRATAMQQTRGADGENYRLVLQAPFTFADWEMFVLKSQVGTHVVPRVVGRRVCFIVCVSPRGPIKASRHPQISRLPDTPRLGAHPLLSSLLLGSRSWNLNPAPVFCPWLLDNNREVTTRSKKQTLLISLSISSPTQPPPTWTPTNTYILNHGLI